MTESTHSFFFFFFFFFFFLTAPPRSRPTELGAERGQRLRLERIPPKLVEPSVEYLRGNAQGGRGQTKEALRPADQVGRAQRDVGASAPTRTATR